MGFNPLQKRCIELAYKHKLSHIASAINTVDVLDSIMEGEAEPLIVLGNAHAALALYVALEFRSGVPADKMIEAYGTHSTRCPYVLVSGGSLGQAETIAVGIAIGNPNRQVNLVTSDGACMEGCVWEAMRIAGEQCHNITVHVIYNGLGAYRTIPCEYVHSALWGSKNNVVFHYAKPLPEPLNGLAGHYAILTEQQYQQLLKA